MTKRDVPELRGVPSTLLITVWARAQASGPEFAVIDDPHARALVAEHPQLFTCFEQVGGYSRSLTTLGVGIRTRCFDRVVTEFLTRCPDGVVVNLGCGLDARSRRLDQGTARWFDVDVAEVQAWRRELLPDDERHTSIDGSITAPAEWLPRIQARPGQAVLVICEGTLMYFAEPVARALVRALVEHFPALEGFVELMGDIGVGKVHPFVRAVGAGAPFRLGARDPAQMLAGWDPRIRVDSKESLFQHEPRRWGPVRWLFKLFPGLHDRFGSVLVKFRRVDGAA